MSRPVGIALAVMGVMTLVSLAYLFDVTERIQSGAGIEEDESGFAALEEPLYEETDPPREIQMFFPATNNDVLIRTRRMTIFESEELENQARQIVDHLIQGPENTNLFSGLPAGTALNQLFISDDGVAYVDFNSALSDNHPGGILPEQATVWSIVDSLTYNLDGIDRVKILINGSEKETLAGHCLLLLPLRTDLSITDIALQAELESEAAGDVR